MKNVIVIGQDFDDVATRMMGGSWAVFRCGSLDAFTGVINDLPNAGVERLDILDHGGRGYINIGQDLLFWSDGDPATPLKNAAVAQAMCPKLTSAAQVRMLGCETGGRLFGEQVGRYLVLKLAGLLNPAEDLGSNRIVFATITPVLARDFTNNGLDRQKELTMLYSSYTAIDYDCPSRDLRFQNVVDHRVVDKALLG